RGPPAKPKVPSVRPDVVASGQLPVKKSKPMHLDEYVVSDNLSGNTHSKIREVFSRLALDLARTFSSHLRLAVILSLGAPFGVAACLISLEHDPISKIACSAVAAVAGLGAFREACREFLGNPTETPRRM